MRLRYYSGKHFNIGYRLFCLLVLCFAISACDEYPKDYLNTLEEARGGTLLVGYTENPPWVIATEERLSGIEVQIVKAFAESIDAEIEWIEKSEQTLLYELEHHNLHLVITGMTRQSPWKGRVGVTNPYMEYNHEEHVMAVPPGENAFLFELETFLNKNEKEIKELFSDYTEY